MENKQKLFCEMQIYLFVLLKIQAQTTTWPHHSKQFKCSRSLAKGVLRMRTARGIICRTNWITDYTIIMLVHKIT